MRVFLVLALILSMAPPAAYARRPDPLPRSFENARLPACPDGSLLHAKIDEKKSKLYLSRWNCKSISPKLLKVAAPRGENSLETLYLIYEGRLFEDSRREQEPTVLYCHSESKAIRVALKKLKDSSFWLAVSDAGEGGTMWSAVTAKESGSVYSGAGDLNPKESIKLELLEGKKSGQLDFRFEIGAGKIGQREFRAGTGVKVQCFEP